jgi:23S rRNA G2445 N2-methylase RlmL
MADELSKAGARRLVVTVAGKVFQRQDLARFLTKAMAERGYSFDEDIEDEVWMFCIDESWYFGLPLFKARALEHRNERAAEREGSLPPPIAAAIAFASVPKNDDVVLDPTCGSGTLLAEFHSFAPDALLIGRDIDKSAVSIARKNLAHISGADVQQADSRSLGEMKPFTLTVANLPFGVQFGDKASNPELYKGILQECVRLRDPKNWRGLFLTSDTEGFSKAAREVPELGTPEVMFKARIRGELATCFRVKA